MEFLCIEVKHKHAGNRYTPQNFSTRRFVHCNPAETRQLQGPQMSRVFLYHYLGDKERKTIVEDDSDETMAIPEKGEILVRNGSIWRINSVTFYGA